MIGENVREIRRKKGISMTELAERSLVSKSYLSNIERNLKTNPTIDILLRVSQVLDVELYDLLDENLPATGFDHRWSQIVDLAKEEGIDSRHISDYKMLFDFIKWHRQQSVE